MSDWITDSQDEQTLEEFLRDADQIHVPVFQRSYVWKQKQLEELVTDIDQVISEVETSQFLGAVVAYEKPRQTNVVGRMRALEVVDGQQRLLTLYLFVMALVEFLSQIDQEEAYEVANEYLLLPPRRGLDVNTRIVPAFDDRNQFRVIWDRLNSPGVLQEKLGSSLPHPPQPSGKPDGDLVKQYKRILRYVKRELPETNEDRLEHLRNLLRIVVGRLTFVHLKLNDGSAATKIFERLNFRGVKVGIIGLVRNEIFSDLAENPVEAKRIFDHVWRPFENELGDRAESFFFPYSLVLDGNTKKSELFVHLRSAWKSLSPEQIIEQMRLYQGPFLAIDKTGIQPGSEQISERLARLIGMRRPSSVYPYIMSMLHSYNHGGISEARCCGLLDALESFLVRRAIVGIEPTGLHALFKSMWSQLHEYTIKGFKEFVSEKPTIQWPDDDEVHEAIATRPLAKATICTFLLEEYDKDLKGDNPDGKPTIEHVLPQTYDDKSEWATLFSKEDHKEYCDLLANLVPLSSPLNSSIQRSPFGTKKERYKNESMYTTPRRVAHDWDAWTPDILDKRTSEMSKWVLERWPYSV